MTNVIVEAFNAPECPLCKKCMKRGSGTCVTQETHATVQSTAKCECGIEVEYTYYIPRRMLDEEYLK